MLDPSWKLENNAESKDIRMPFNLFRKNVKVKPKSFSFLLLANCQTALHPMSAPIKYHPSPCGNPKEQETAETRVITSQQCITAHALRTPRPRRWIWQRKLQNEAASGRWCFSCIITPIDSCMGKTSGQWVTSSTGRPFFWIEASTRGWMRVTALLQGL